MLPVILPEETVDQLFKECAAAEGYQLTIDLEAQEVRTPNSESFKFEVDPFRKHCLLNGLDDIGLTLQAADDIRAYEEKPNNHAHGYLLKFIHKTAKLSWHDCEGLANIRRLLIF